MPNVVLDEQKVRALFNSCDKECDVLIALFALAVPEWERVEYVLEGRPSLGGAGWHAIYDLFCRFNEEHPGESAFPGGLWLSMGFSKDESLGPWEADSTAMKLVMKK
jgi:hypothetical protein